MKAIILYGAVKKNDYGLSTVMQIVYNTLKELGIEVTEIQLADTYIPYYSGAKNDKVNEIMEKLSTADAIIFAYTTHFYAPASCLCAFVEYFEYSDYKFLINGKNCMNITVCKGLGERDSSNHVARIISKLGGYEAARLAIGGSNQLEIGKNALLQEIIEKQVEDYYRVFKQKRKFLFSSEMEMGSVTTPVYTDLPLFEPPEPTAKDISIQELLSTKEQYINTEPEKIKERKPEWPIVPTVTPVQQKSEPLREFQVPAQAPPVYNEFVEKQESDIEELTRFFAQKLGDMKPPTPAPPKKTPQMDNGVTYTRTYAPTPTPIVSRAKTCKQMALSLPHYYQSQLALDTECIIQLSITGSETFDCYLALKGSENKAMEGVFPNPDITIITECNILSDILSGKYTAQKAFITGQLRVRGNFMILNKFDTLYKKM